METTWANQDALANLSPAGKLGGLDNVSAILVADRAFPTAVDEL